MVYESQRGEPRLASPFLSLVGGSGPVYPVGESEVESSLSERFLALVFVPLVWRAGRWSHIDPVWLFTLSSESSRRVGSGLDFRLREVRGCRLFAVQKKFFERQLAFVVQCPETVRFLVRQYSRQAVSWSSVELLLPPGVRGALT